MDWFDFYKSLQPDFESMVTSVLPQFGTPQKPYLFARLLPERTREDVYDLHFTEIVLGYQTTPALDNTRYSPVQFGQVGMTQAEIKGTFGHTDIANQLTSRDHDGIVRMLQSANDIEAAARAVNWADSTLLTPHLDKNEIQRATAIILGQVVREAINGATQTVNLPVPSGHRPEVLGGTVGTPAGWFADDYDILPDILAGQQTLANKGFVVTDMFATTDLATLIKNNPPMAQRAGGIVFSNGTTIETITGTLNDTQLNGIFNDNGLPGLTRYDSGYRKPLLNGNTRFTKFMEPTTTHHYFVMVGNTGRSEEITANEDVMILSNTLGYYGLGRNPGQSVWGRTVFTEVLRKKPVGLYGESYQTGFPIVMNYDAIYVIRVAKPTA